MIAFLTNLAGPDFILIAIVFVLLFGAKLLPKWARSLRETKDEIEKLHDDKES